MPRLLVGEEEEVVGVCVWIGFRRIRRLGERLETPQVTEDEPGPPPLCGQALEANNGLFV